MAFRFTVVGSGGEKKYIYLVSGWVLGGPRGSRSHAKAILRCLETLSTASGQVPDGRQNPSILYFVKCKFAVSPKIVF